MKKTYKDFLKDPEFKKQWDVQNSQKIKWFFEGILQGTYFNVYDFCFFDMAHRHFTKMGARFIFVSIVIVILFSFVYYLFLPKT